MLEDVDVPLHQVQPALAILLTDSGRHHHDAGVCRHRVVWNEEEGEEEEEAQNDPTVEEQFCISM